MSDVFLIVILSELESVCGCFCCCSPWGDIEVTSDDHAWVVVALIDLLNQVCEFCLEFILALWLSVVADNYD